MKDKISKEKFLGLAKKIGESAKSTAETVGSTVKSSASTFVATAKESSEQFEIKREQHKYENDIKKYHPINEDFFRAGEFVKPSVVRAVKDDVRRDVEVCKGAVGFITGEGANELLNVYTEHCDLLGDINWYPEFSEGVYRVDPCEENRYIRIDLYFQYMKKARVDELISIAKDLGAKNVEVVLKVHEKNFSAQKQDGQLHIGKFSLGSVGVSVSNSNTQNHASSMEVAAKVDFKGGSEPVTPKVKYFKKESDIQDLINMRMSKEDNQILSKRYSLRYGSSSGISINEAEKIDAAIAMAGAGGNASRTVTSEVQIESDTLLEYYIEF